MPHPALPKTWIMVADAAQATAWEVTGRDGPLAAVPDFRLAAADTHGFSRDLKSDRPGRSFSSSDSRRAAMQPPHDPHEQAKARFMAMVSERLVAAHRDKRFAQLIVMAPPRMLGVLRDEYRDTLAGCIVGEVDKDLTKATSDDILAHARPFLKTI
jgi:protein required for attachment to host cells